MNLRGHAGIGWVFCATLAFLLLTAPANHQEAEDAYFYALKAESGVGSELFHRHHLLYLPMARAVYRLARAFGYDGRSFPLLVGLSSIAGAAAVAMFFSSLPRRGSASAFGLLFSYGFWRYATTVEIYIPAVALALAAVSYACRAAQQTPAPRPFLVAMVLSTGALLLHLATAPAVFVAIVSLYLLQGQWRRALLHGVIVTVAVAIVYAAVSRTKGTVVYHDETILRTGLRSWTSWLAAFVAFGHTILSGNFVVARPSVIEFLSKLAPERMLHEELFMGMHEPAMVRLLSPWTAGMAAAFMLLAAMKGMAHAFRQRREVLLSSGASTIAAAVWLVGSGALALWFEPSNPEMWLLALPPFWWLIGHAFGDGEGGHRSYRCNSLVLWMAVVTLLIHNAVGGAALVWSAEGDYALTKARLVSAHAHAGDWVLTADSHSTVTCLQYYTAAKVVDGRFVDVSRWDEMLEREPPQQVWILREFFEPPPAIRTRSRRFEAQREALAERLRPRAEPVGPADHAMIYRWTPPERPPPGDKPRLGT